MRDGRARGTHAPNGGVLRLLPREPDRVHRDRRRAFRSAGQLGQRARTLERSVGDHDDRTGELAFGLQRLA